MAITSLHRASWLTRESGQTPLLRRIIGRLTSCPSERVQSSFGNPRRAPYRLERDIAGATLSYQRQPPNRALTARYGRQSGIPAALLVQYRKVNLRVLSAGCSSNTRVNLRLHRRGRMLLTYVEQDGMGLDAELKPTPDPSWPNLVSQLDCRGLAEGSAEVIGQRLGGGDGFVAGLDLDGSVAAGGADESAD